MRGARTRAAHACVHRSANFLHVSSSTLHGLPEYTLHLCITSTPESGHIDKVATSNSHSFFYSFFTMRYIRTACRVKSSHHTSRGPESSQVLLPVDMNFMTPRVGSAARRLQHCQMTPNSYSEIRVKTTGISNILAATRQSTEKLPCDSIVARSRFGLVTCVIHEPTDSANLPSVSSQGTVPSTVHQ